jgi:hypothetical protein
MFTACARLIDALSPRVFTVPSVVHGVPVATVGTATIVDTTVAQCRRRGSPRCDVTADLDAHGSDFGADAHELFDDELEHPLSDRVGRGPGEDIDEDADLLGVRTARRAST